ncbi:MAG: hypothetical protein EAX87_06590 [Candidatus Thorarchaeota archaeon]|nr:hypothetical protein [Candidatus Thorarchaeota archaeon]
MKQLTLKIYVRSMKITTSSVDLDSVGHQCANPMRTGAYDRMGSEEILLDQEQTLLVDAAIRASTKMNWQLVIVDVAKYSILKRIRMKETIPRLELDGKIMVGNPSSDEIIQFFKKSNMNHSEDLVDIRQSERAAEIS